eukprot:TRINITY_DN1592_c0_g1_i1.p2 TRINITY_DN1592_c0_g1~~TRINITY_DN1592_c0_g1_i1.p2  ORF type:complete len:174 (-),score=44.48 TRINITY_DN1592_c0_g1_i1:182-703(-)
MNKIAREAKELKAEMKKQISGNLFDIQFDYSPIILQKTIKLFKQSIQALLTFMLLYNLNPQLIKENLIDIQYNPQKQDYLKDIPSSAKAALTKCYNKMHAFKAEKKKRITGTGLPNEKFDPNINENIEEVYDDKNVDKIDQQEDETKRKGKNNESKLLDLSNILERKKKKKQN